MFEMPAPLFIWNHNLRLWKISPPKYDYCAAQESPSAVPRTTKTSRTSIGEKRNSRVRTTRQENQAFGRRYARAEILLQVQVQLYRGDENAFSPRSTLTRLAVTGTRGPGCTGPVIRATHRRVDHGCAAAFACVRTTRLSGRGLSLDAWLLGLGR